MPYVSVVLCGFRPVLTGVPIGTRWSPHPSPYPLHYATMPHTSMSKQVKSLRKLWFIYKEYQWSTLYHNQLVTTTPSCSWDSFLHLRHSWVYSQVKLWYTTASSRVGGKVQLRVKHADSHATVVFVCSEIGRTLRSKCCKGHVRFVHVSKRHLDLSAASFEERRREHAHWLSETLAGVQ